MKTIKNVTPDNERQTWEESSGLIAFLSSVNKEVDAFNDTFEFGIVSVPGVLKSIDGDPSLPFRTGFVLERRNPLLPEVTYCLYSILSNRTLSGYVGICRDGRVDTLRELKPIKDFNNAKAALYEWLRQLVRASFEKTTP